MNKDCRLCTKYRKGWCDERNHEISNPHHFAQKCELFFHYDTDTKNEIPAHLKDEVPVNAYVSENNGEGKKNTDSQNFDFQKFSIFTQTDQMKTEIENEKYILPGLALTGQSTLINSPPNAGKTLLVIQMLIQAVKTGGVDGDKIIYINADDTLKGLIEKQEILKPYGIHCVVPGYPVDDPFEPRFMLNYLHQSVKNKTCKGLVLVTDTIKKFVEVMDKRSSTEFMKVARLFVQHGGTIIMLGHVNKNKSADGKSIYAGTTDLVDDCDCAWMLDITGEINDERDVLFENIKARGNVEKLVSFKYSTRRDQTYMELLQSVKRLDDYEAKQAIKDREAFKSLNEHEAEIAAILECIDEKIINQTKIEAEARKRSGASRRTIQRVLKLHAGEDFKRGHRWGVNYGINNKKLFYRLYPK